MAGGNLLFTCPHCNKRFATVRGRGMHLRAVHPKTPSSTSTSPLVSPDSSPRPAPNPLNPPDPPLQTHEGRARKLNHPHLTGKYLSVYSSRLRSPLTPGEPCDARGNPLPPGTPPPPYNQAPNNDWSPFPDGDTFEIADFIFREDKMSNKRCDHILNLWAKCHCDDLGAPFNSHTDLHNSIDAIQHGEAPWRCLETQPPANLPADAPLWQTRQYDIWYRDPKQVIANILKNPDFKDDIDYAPYELRGPNGKRRWTNFLSGNFSWRQAVSSFPFGLSPR